MENFQMAVDPGLCQRCRRCIQDCPNSVFREKDGMPEVIEENVADCIGCQHCLAICPTGALSVFGLDPKNSLSLTPSALPTPAQLRTLVRGRRSVRSFRPENVERELIDAILADTRHAPTGCNAQSLSFLVVDERQELAGLLLKVVDAVEKGVQAGRDVPDFLAMAVQAYRRDGSDHFFRGAPHLLVVAGGEKAVTPQADVLITLSYFELLVASAGLGATWCGMLDLASAVIPEIRGIFGLAPDIPFYSLMFGRPGVHYARTV
ncbi:MAG: nitroreductase family protein, partial [Planctomycetota bacterium]|nr:nitroreductase family protein [Planctomycetota bacterium]